MRDLFRMTSKALEIKMVKHHHYLKKKNHKTRIFDTSFSSGSFPNAWFWLLLLSHFQSMPLAAISSWWTFTQIIFLSAMENAEIEESILMEDSITNFIFQDMSSLLFLPLMRVVINFHVNYAPSQGIKSAVKNLNWALLQSTALTKKWHQSHELTTFLKAMRTVSFFGSFPTSTPQFAIKICCFRLWYWILSWKLQKWERMLPFRAETLLPLGFFWRRKRISFIEKHQ